MKSENRNPGEGKPGEKKKKKIRYRAGKACMILGVVLVCAAFGLFAYNRVTDYLAGQSADDAVAELKDVEPGDSNPYDTEMTECDLDGDVYIGYLVIPALDLELPVQSTWSYAGLKVSPCRYTGSTKTDDLIICAHNYSSHFGNIKTLNEGDAVYFIDLDGKTWQYEVAEVTTLQPTAIEEMTDSGYDLTLFTCTYGGQYRVTVRCLEVD